MCFLSIFAIKSHISLILLFYSNIAQNTAIFPIGLLSDSLGTRKSVEKVAIRGDIKKIFDCFLDIGTLIVGG